ncbi:alternative oxidase, mitochondrial-like [Acanthaster planci]|uniref:Alternative oxidase, mitochondrial-like n=1 Tax=Acanthaster planci TaxID=133434 RepID=A0A8B7YC75_ACAPL|nr:alternative oxidase, mitochondrial-like [Acanthaster planci]
MLTVTAKQASLCANNLIHVWPRSFSVAVRALNDSITGRPLGLRDPSPCQAAGACRPYSLITGGLSRPCTAKLTSTRTAGKNILAQPFNLSSSSTLKQRFVSTTSPQDETAGDSTKQKPKLAPHFRISSGKTSAGDIPHPKATTDEDENGEDSRRYLLPHPIWSDKELHSVEITHKPPQGFVDWFAYTCVQTLRFSFDLLSGYKRGVRTEKKWLIRIIFLETVAGVPGMVAAMTRHLRSLRRMQRDHGWIHTLLEEAENERMHLMTALELRKPGRLFTMAVLFTQGIFVNMFFLAYLCSPRFCHRFVGYLEEEAVITYTKLIQDLDNKKLLVWGNMAAPDLAIRYWKLKPDANMRDMILAIRADEAHHRKVNHFLSDLKPDDSNPFPPGQ